MGDRKRPCLLVQKAIVSISSSKSTHDPFIYLLHIIIYAAYFGIPFPLLLSANIRMLPKKLSNGDIYFLLERHANTATPILTHARHGYKFGMSRSLNFVHYSWPIIITFDTKII